MRVGYTFAWWYRGQLHESSVEAACPKCGRTAVVALPTVLAAAQPDETTHVCHPSVGGCNYGFSRELTFSVSAENVTSLRERYPEIADSSATAPPPVIELDGVKP